MQLFESGQYDKKQVSSIVLEALGHSQNYDTDDAQGNKEDALKMYLGKPRGDEKDGRSQLQSMDVSDMINAATAQLVPMLSLDAFVEFPPKSNEDEEQATTESVAVNSVIMDNNNGYLRIMEAVKDALLMRNGVLKVYVEEKVEKRTATYPDPTEEELAYIIANQPPNVEVDGDILVDEDGETTVKYLATQRVFKVKAIDPRQFLFEREWDRHDVQDCPFVAERWHPTRSELIDLGFDAELVEKIPEGYSHYRDKYIRRYDGHNVSGHTRDLDRLEVYECYIQIDQDNDGVAELYRIFWSNNTVLAMEPWPWVPYACGTAILYTHDLEGESLYDKIRHVQDAKTAALRQWADNLFNCNHTRTAAVEDMVNLDDLTTVRPGGVVRVRTQDALMPLPVHDIGPSAEAMMAYQDKIRMERGGAALDMQSNQSQVVGESYAGIERQYTSKELQVQQFAKTLAETLVRPTYLLMHRTLRMWSNEPLMVKHQGQWIEADPSQWPDRTDVVVSVGKTVGQRNSAQQNLLMFVQMAQQALQAGLGGQIVDLSGIHKAMSDWLSMSGIEAAEQYLIDPTSQQAQQAAQAQQQREQQAQQMAAQQQQEVIELDRWKHASELQYKYFDSALDNETRQGEQLSKVQVEAAKLAQGSIDNARNRQAQAESSAADNSKDDRG